MMLQRLAFAAALGSLAPLVLGERPAGKGADPTPPRTLRVNTFVPYPALVAADERGAFADEGLRVAWEITPSSTVQMQGLAAGRWDIAITAFDNLLASRTREGVQSVAFGTADTIDLPLYVRPEIPGYADLRGKPLAVDAVDTAFALVLRRLLLAHGLDLQRGDYTLVGAGAPQPRLDSIVLGETVGGILNPPWDAHGERAGLRRLGHHAEVLPAYPGSVFAATADWLAAPANRAAAGRFLRAWQHGVAWATANRAAARDLLARTRNVPPAAADTLLDAMLTDLRLDPAGLAGVRALRVELGLPPPPGAVEAYYDLRLYEEVRR